MTRPTTSPTGCSAPSCSPTIRSVRETAGDRDTVQAINAADVRRFFESHYHAGSMVVTFAGPIDHDEALKLISSAFAEVRPDRGDGGASATAVDRRRTTRSTTTPSRCTSSWAVAPWPAATRIAKRSTSSTTSSAAGLSSRLFEEIRERRGLAYSVYSGVSAYADSGAFQMYAGTQPEHGDEVIGLMRAELDRLVSDGITDDELDVAVGYLTGAFELGLEDTGARMARNGAQLITTGSIRPIGEQVERWAAVDQTAVKRIIGRVFTDDPIVVTVGPAL